MRAIAAHFRYISKNGKLRIEDDRGQAREGKDALGDLGEEWRFGGSLIADVSERREAFNIMLSMPRGTDPLTVQWAAREFAKTELADHMYVMVLHDHQANPHVHLSVRAESRSGKRLNPRKTDLHRWRETFASKLRERGVEAEATRQATRGGTRGRTDLWQLKANEQRRLRAPRPTQQRGRTSSASRKDAVLSWRALAAALSASSEADDRKLAGDIENFTKRFGGQGQATREPDRAQPRLLPETNRGLER